MDSFLNWDAYLVPNRGTNLQLQFIKRMAVNVDTHYKPSYPCYFYCRLGELWHITQLKVCIPYEEIDRLSVHPEPLSL